MHAAYLFLMELPIHASVKELKEETISEFDAKYGPFCGPDNWRRILTLVTRTGRIVTLAEPWVNLKAISLKKRWDWAWKFGLECVACEMQLFDVPCLRIAPDPGGARRKIQNLSFEELLTAIRTEIPRTLSAAYATYSTGGKQKDRHQADSLRRKRALVFETFNACSRPPFASPRSPEEYRAFSLCNPEKGNAVLFVDIHT